MRHLLFDLKTRALVLWFFHLRPIPSRIYWFPRRLACKREWHKWSKIVEAPWVRAEWEFPPNKFWGNNCMYCAQHRGITIDTHEPVYRRDLKNKHWRPSKRDLLPVVGLSAWKNTEPNRGWVSVSPGETQEMIDTRTV